MLEGYSASEIKDIIKEVCMVPLRELDRRTFEEIDKRKIRNVCVKDFVKLIKERPPLLSKN